MKNIVLGIVGVVVLGGLLFWAGSATQEPLENDGDIVATNGIHWHPTLTIYKDGEQVEIPANVGLMGSHESIHTHAEDVAQGVLHFEFNRMVRTGDLKLQNFFTIWDNKNIATAFGALERMTVNGEENTELGEYVVQSEDKIELFYKSDTAE